MEGLYHQTNRLLQEITSQDLFRYERSNDEDEKRTAEAVVQEKLDAISGHCGKLDILANKEPPAKRVNAKCRVDQLKYDLQHVVNSLRMLQNRWLIRQREAQEREALMARRFTTNDHADTTVLLDHELTHHNRLQDAHRNVDEILDVGHNIMHGIREQGSVLKNAHRRVLDFANTLGLSNTVMRLIERRSVGDKYILFGGMGVVTLVLVLLLWYF